MVALFPAFAALPAARGEPPLHVVPVPTSNRRWPAPRIAFCGECGRIPADERTRSCLAANCGLIGRAHHGQGCDADHTGSETGNPGHLSTIGSAA